MVPENRQSSNNYLGQHRLKLTLIKQDKEGHFILKKAEIHQKEITIINLYAPNVSAPNFNKHTLKDLKAYRDSGSGRLYYHPSPIYRSSKQKNQ
jgi:hypothetical protein